MLTGIFAARNVAGAAYDLWQVNADAEYHEEAPAADRLAPLPLAARTPHVTVATSACIPIARPAGLAGGVRVPAHRRNPDDQSEGSRASGRRGTRDGG